MTLAIGHAEERDGATTVVLDCIRERRPPFSPEDVTAEFCALLGTYRVESVVGDRYGGAWCQEPFQRRCIRYEPADRPKSDLYRDALPLLTSGQVELLDSTKLKAQLVGLERRTARGGRDTIDHAPNAHDDLANAALGVVAELARLRQPHRQGLLHLTRAASCPQSRWRSRTAFVGPSGGSRDSPRRTNGARVRHESRLTGCGAVRTDIKGGLRVKYRRGAGCGRLVSPPC